MAKIFRDHNELADRLAFDRAAGARVVMSNGAFDIFHVGHLRSLIGAAAEGDKLLVAINSDRSVRENKGPGRPINSEDERMEILAALTCVDYVTLFDDKTVDRLLLLLRPEVYAKGTDYDADKIPETPTLRAYGGRLAIVGDPKDHSSTDLIERIRQAHPAS